MSDDEEHTIRRARYLAQQYDVLHRANGDLAEILAQFTNYIMNERVRSYNEGFDTGRKAAHER